MALFPYPSFGAFSFDAPVLRVSLLTFSRGFSSEAESQKLADAVKALNNPLVTVEVTRQDFTNTSTAYEPNALAYKVLALLQETKPTATIDDVTKVGTRYDTRFAERVERQTTVPYFTVTVKGRDLTQDDTRALRKVVEGQ